MKLKIFIHALVALSMLSVVTAKNPKHPQHQAPDWGSYDYLDSEDNLHQVDWDTDLDGNKRIVSDIVVAPVSGGAYDNTVPR